MNVNLSKNSALVLLLILFAFSCKRSDIAHIEVLDDPLLLQLSPKQSEADFKNAGYNAELFESLGSTESVYWRPLWDKAEIRQIDSITYQYIRLEPKGAHNTKFKMNAVKFIIRKITEENDSSKSKWQIATYISNDNPLATNGKTIPSFAKFSGFLQLKDLETKENHILEYKDGVRVTQKTSRNAQARSISCATKYHVTWNAQLCDGTLLVLHLIQDNTWWKPQDPPCTLQDSGWSMAHSETLLECYWVDDTPPPSGGGDGDNGGGDNDGGTGTSDLTVDDVVESTMYTDDNPKIDNLQKFLDCFGDGKSTDHYSLTIYVDQPVRGENDWFRITFPVGSPITNNPYNVPTGITWVTPGGKLFDVGHTFVSFEKQNTDGTYVKQILGFYPNGFPIASAGAIKDDSGHTFDVSYKINVNQSQFNAAVAALISDYQNKDYVLFNSPAADAYNCTDAAIRWMNAAGANLTGGGTLPFNNTPGQFGQVLKSKTGAVYEDSAVGTSKGACN